MKKIKNSIRIITVMCAALGWWGLLFPGLTLTPDTVSAVSAEENGEELTPERLYLELLGAEHGSIRFRSRLLTELNAFWEAFSWENSTEK